MDLVSQGTAVIVGPDGTPATVPSVELSADDARLLREYKKFLRRHGLREGLWCNTCESLQHAPGTEAHVTDTDVLIRCRHRVLWHKGQQF